MTGFRGNFPVWWEMCDYGSVQSPPMVDKCLVMEQRKPWRKGIGIVLRLPFTQRAVSFGRWSSRQETVVDLFGEQTLKLREHSVDEWKDF